MAEKKILWADDEIDLLSLIESIWDGKWKIAFIVAVSLLSVLGFNKSKSEKIVSKVYFENKDIELQELIKRSLNKL